MFCLSLIFPILVFAHDEVQIDTLHQDDAPVLVEFPFRVVASNSCEWALKAWGDALPPSTLTLDNGWTSCACTKLYQYPTQPLAVGDSGIIVARFHPAGQEGDVLRNIAVNCKEYGDDAPVADLLISGYVLPPRDPFYNFPFRHGALRLLQDHVTLDGEHNHRSVFVANTDSTAPLKVRVRTDPNSGLEIPEWITIEPQSSMPLDIRMGHRPKKGAKSKVEWIKLQWNEDEETIIDVLISK